MILDGFMENWSFYLFQIKKKIYSQINFIIIIIIIILKGIKKGCICFGPPTTTRKLGS